MKLVSDDLKEKQKKKWHRLRLGVRRDWQLMLIVLVPVLVLAVFSYGPMFGVLYAFQDVSLRGDFLDNEWVGIKWFGKFFNGYYAGRLIRNTLILNFWNLFGIMIASIFMALVFNEVRNDKIKRITQSCTYFPHFISVTVIVTMMSNMLDPTTGVLSNVAETLLGWEPVDLFQKPNAFRPMYVLSGMWSGAGWGAIIYMGSITGIDQNLYEAAAIDGAGRLSRIRHVTLPGIKPVVITLLILNIGKMMSLGAGKILLMYNSATYETADVISTYVYRYGIGGAEFGYTTAVGLFNSVINIILLLTANAISKKVSETSLF